MLSTELVKAMSLSPVIAKHVIEAHRLNNIKADNPVKFDKARRLARITTHPFDDWFKQDSSALDIALKYYDRII